MSYFETIAFYFDWYVRTRFYKVLVGVLCVVMFFYCKYVIMK